MPVSVWEENMPTLDAAMRESIRLTLNGLVLRRNTQREGKLNIPGGGGEVSNGAFLAYDMSDTHLNPDIYTDPGTFDPERFNPGREEDKREPYGFLGWGAGECFCFLFCPFLLTMN
jgi:sterol 14-demethylase